MTLISDRVEQVLARIEQAAIVSGRQASEIDLELAIKTRSVEECARAARALIEAGHPAILGQNRVQEAQITTPYLRELDLAGLTTTMIGPLQTNKINRALEVVDQIETIDSVRLAEAVNKRVKSGVIEVMIQVNTSGEESKSGAHPREALDVAHQVSLLEHLKVIGFMTIGAHTHDQTLVSRSFATLRDIRDSALGLIGLEQATELSMGMTSDFELAIAEGATRVRMGSAIFGKRSQK